MQDQDIAIIALAFSNYVQAGDAKIDRAIAHAGDDIARALKEHNHLGQALNGGLVLARIGLVNRKTARFEKFEAFFSQATLRRQRDADGGGHR